MLFENVILAFRYLVSGKDHVLLRDPAHTTDGRHQPLALMDKGLPINMLEKSLNGEFTIYFYTWLPQSSIARILSYFHLKSPVQSYGHFYVP